MAPLINGGCMSHYVGLKDLMLLEFHLEDECPQEIIDIATQGDFKGVAALLDSKYEDFRDTLLNEAGLDTNGYFYSLEGKRRSNFTGNIQQDIWWVGDLRKDLGFTTEHQVYKDLTTQKKYEGVAEEIMHTGIEGGTKID